MKIKRLARYLGIILIIAIILLSFSCAPRDKIGISGNLIEQVNHSGFLYDVVEYTILLSDNSTFAFKVRKGSLLPLNQDYFFALEYIEGDEYIATSVQQISTK